MLSWLRNRSRHRRGRHALRGEVDRNRQEIEGLKAQSAALRNQLASLAAQQMAEAAEPLPEFEAAARTYCPAGRALHVTSAAGQQHVLTGDWLGDPREWTAWISAPESVRLAS